MVSAQLRYRIRVQLRLAVVSSLFRVVILKSDCLAGRRDVPLFVLAKIWMMGANYPWFRELLPCGSSWWIT
jgi:hypothetical protein